MNSIRIRLKLNSVQYHRPVEQITFLIYSPFPSYSGGRENWLLNLSPRLTKRGWRVVVIGLETDRPPFHSLDGTGIELASLPSMRARDSMFTTINRLTLGLAANLDMLIVYPRRAGGHLKRTDPGRLVCMNPVPEGLAAIVSGRRFIVSVRGDLPTELSSRVPMLRFFFRWLERFVLRRAAAVLANGSDTQIRLRKDAGIESEVVVNGVDVDRFAVPGPEDGVVSSIKAHAAGRKLIASVGTIRPIKGVGDAIDCATFLKRSGCSFLLALVGKGDASAYMHQVEKLGLDGSVEFPGETTRVPALLHASDVFLATSGGGGIAMATLEAMAAGVPIVARDTPTYRQIIDDGRTGLLARDADEMARACIRLFDDHELAGKLAEQARLEARRYDWERVADSFLQRLTS